LNRKKAVEKRVSKEIISHDYIESVHVHRPWTVSNPTVNMDLTTDRMKGFKPPLAGPQMLSIDLGLEYDVPSTMSQKGKKKIPSFNLQKMTERRDVGAKHVVDALYDITGTKTAGESKAVGFAGYASRSSPREYPFLSQMCTRKDELVHLTYNPSFTLVEKRARSAILGSKRVLSSQRTPSQFLVDNLAQTKRKEAGLGNYRMAWRDKVPTQDGDHHSRTSFPHETRFTLTSPRTLGKGIEREISFLREHSKGELHRAKKLAREKRKHDEECQILRQRLKEWGKPM
jgi:hypothetical protein